MFLMYGFCPKVYTFRLFFNLFLVFIVRKTFIIMITLASLTLCQSEKSIPPRIKQLKMKTNQEHAYKSYLVQVLEQNLTPKSGVFLLG